MPSESHPDDCSAAAEPRGAAQGLWCQLLSGQIVVVSALKSGARMHFRLAPAAEFPDRVLTQRERRVLEYAAQGHTSKVMALELGLAASTVSGRLTSAAKKLGVSTRQLLLLMAVTGVGHARDALAHGAPPGLDDDAPASSRPRLSFTWPLTPRTGGLTPAERAIVCLLLEGRSTADITRARGTSPHTVGNQIALLYEKLRVNNRVDLARRVCSASGAEADDEAVPPLPDAAHAS